MSFVGPPGREGRAGRTRRLGSLVGTIDDAGDAWGDRLRGRRWADVVSSVLSNLSDHGVVWVMVACVKARNRGPGRRRAVLALAGAGISSFTVNQAVKRSVGRERPGTVVEAAGAAPGSLPVRRPTSSSFPSGHTLAAFCTAVVLSDGPAETATALGFATAVAASRVHLRAHHLSDVVGGAVIGAATGVVVRAVLDRVLPRPGEA